MHACNISCDVLIASFVARYSRRITFDTGSGDSSTDDRAAHMASVWLGLNETGPQL
jgi:hypothetical protein